MLSQHASKALELLLRRAWESRENFSVSSLHSSSSQNPFLSNTWCVLSRTYLRLPRVERKNSLLPVVSIDSEILHPS